MNKIQKSVKHITQIHASLYTKTFNKDQLAGKKALLRINLKRLDELDREATQIEKEIIKLRAEIKAYEEITQ